MLKMRTIKERLRAVQERQEALLEQQKLLQLIDDLVAVARRTGH